MSAPRTYYADDGEGRPTFTPKGLRPSKAMVRADRVIAEGFKRMGLPFDDASHRAVRSYIARMGLSAAQLARLVSFLGQHDTGRYPVPADSDRCERYACDYGTYRRVVFYCYRAALSLLVETAPRSRLDLDDLLPLLMAWPGALPPSMQPHVAAAIGAHIADTLTGQPFKRRPLVPKQGRTARR